MVVVVAMEPEVEPQVGMEVEQEVVCHGHVPGDSNLNLMPDNLPRPV